MSSYGSGSLPMPGNNGGALFASVPEAAKAQNLEAVIDLLNQGYSVDAQDLDGNTGLHWGAWFRLDAVVATLLERNARPNIGNSSGETAVHWAAKASNISALDSLTRGQRGLLSVRDCDGFTPFIISAQNDNAPVMEWMYLKGISVEEQDDWGRTALQWACYKGHRRTVQWLLSRFASIVHRDHEGMTAIHWAALKGHEQAAEMLLEVGAAHLLQVPDAAGDTPIALATRKKNRYLVMSFYKCQVLQSLIGRPYVSRNHFANLFVGFIAFNVLVFAFILAPGIANAHPRIILLWSALMGMSLLLWVQNCSSDPGWIQPRTILAQSRIIGDDPDKAFDAEQPVESQMVHYDGLAQDWVDEDGLFGQNLQRMEFEQAKFNYQRQLISEARKRLSEGDCCGNKASGTELQPLIGGTIDDGSVPIARQAQLERAALVLQERERATAETIGRARVEQLLGQGCGEYLTLVDKGDFKQVCVVCRTRRKMRSHHCKECGRCVDRLDHHCPWIDNCVGIGNQRSFYCFIVMLLLTLATFYHVVVLYAFDALFPELAQGSLRDLMNALSSGSLGPELQPLLVMASAAFNLVWLAFVGALVARHTAYMAINVTTYEVLVRPPHMQRRFPKNRGRFWFLQDLGLLPSIRHCIDYWTLNTDRDAADFFGGALQDSFVAPGQDPDIVALGPGGPTTFKTVAGDALGPARPHDDLPEAGAPLLGETPPGTSRSIA